MFDFSVSVCYNKFMKKNSGSESPKYFRFQFTPALIVMSIAALLVSATAFGISVYNISKNGIHSFNDVLTLDRVFIPSLCW